MARLRYPTVKGKPMTDTETEKILPDHEVINIETSCVTCGKRFKSRLQFYFGDWLICPFCCAECRHEFFQKLNGDKNHAI